MDRSNRFLASETTFTRAFPSLEAVLIESAEVGKGTDYQIGARPSSDAKYGHQHRLTSGLVRCSNPACARGGYELEFDIYDMLREKIESKEFTKACVGDEGSPKGMRGGKKCLNFLKYRLTLIYKSAASA